MSLEVPETLEEWTTYISSLHGDILWSKGIAANTLEFVVELQKILGPEEISQVLLSFARQFDLDDQAMPGNMPGQYLSYIDLIQNTIEV